MIWSTAEAESCAGPFGSTLDTTETDMENHTQKNKAVVRKKWATREDAVQSRTVFLVYLPATRTFSMMSTTQTIISNGAQGRASVEYSSAEKLSFQHV